MHDSKLRPWALALTLLCVLAAQPASAQYFGQNKVQYETHDWSIIETDNFQVYFHEGERRVALDVARMAERAYTRISTILNHEIADPVPIILSASHAEFQVSNVSQGFVGEGTGGFTEFLKRRVSMPVTGDYGETEHVMTHELVHAFQIDLLTHGSRSMGAGLRWVPPLWVMEGMAEYVSTGDLDPLTEMWLRDGALEGYLLPVTYMDRVYDIRVYRYGQAIMSYIGHTFGDEKIGEFFKKLAVTRNVSRAMEESIGVTLEKLSDNFIQEMRKTYLPAVADHDRPDDFAFRLTHSERELANVNLSPSISPDGDHVVFFSDRSLYNDLYLASAIDGTVEKRLVKGERNPEFESLRYFRSTADWSPDGENICFVALSEGRDAIYVQRVRDEKILHKLRFELDGINSPSFSNDGQWIVFSGMDDGSSNLYRVRVDGTGLEQLTDDRFMVREPRYSSDGTRIVFVTDRGLETDFDRLLFANPSIAIYDLASEKIRVLPDQPGTNISPHFLPGDEYVLYVSDRSGIANIYLRNLATDEDRRITNVLTGVSGIIPTGTAASLSRNGKRLVFSAFSRGGLDLFAIKNPLDMWEDGTPWQGAAPEPMLADDPDDLSIRIALDDDSTLPQPRRLDPVSLHGSGTDEPTVSETEPAGDSASATDEAEQLGPDLASNAGDDPFELFGPSEEAEETDPEVEARLDSLWSSIRQIDVPEGAVRGSDSLPTFAQGPESHAEEEVVVTDVFAENLDLPDPTAFKIERYSPKFSADYVSANGFFANNVGLAAQSVLQFSDVLGDQIILVGADVYGSFSDSDLFLGYTNLRHRISWGISAFQYRNDFYIFTAEDTDDFVSQIYRGVNLTVQRPFNRFRRIETSLSGMAVSESVYRGSFYSQDFSADETGTRFYFQPGLALVTDKTLYGYTGPISGGRDRISFDVAVGDLEYRTWLGDVRRYYNVRQRYALALRGIAATSDGRDPQYFRIGGPYTVRGYDYGEFRGTKIAMANVEFRFPLIEQLRLGWPLPLALQGVRGAIFFDVGGAWDETSAFKPAESHSGSFRLRDLRASYGLSTSMNVGFTVLKWDLAWKTDLFTNLGKPAGSISFGLDY
ncbi:MAG: BamA/TamA family outer membrane protein [Candidatus Eisenbacteria bacterium]